MPFGSGLTKPHWMEAQNETIRAELGGRAGGCPDLVRDDSLYHVGGGTMKKYNTRPIDFTGCHPVIAEHLKRCEMVKCRVWDSFWDRGGETEAWICRYLRDSKLPYKSDSDVPWKNAEPLPIKVKRIMPPERAIPVLIAEGWAFNKFGDLICPGWVILSHAFQYFGKPGYTPGAANHSWPPCIIEEVEDDE